MKNAGKHLQNRNMGGKKIVRIRPVEANPNGNREQRRAAKRTKMHWCPIHGWEKNEHG